MGTRALQGREEAKEVEREHAGKSRVGVKEERLNCNAIEEQFVKLVHMHTGLQSPSAHIISSLLVTSTKTKRSRMLQMYYVGGIIKSNPSQSQLYLPKDTGQSCMHSWYLCVCVRVCILAFVSMSNFHCPSSHKNISLNILAPSKMGKQLLRV